MKLAYRSLFGCALLLAAALLATGAAVAQQTAAPAAAQQGGGRRSQGATANPAGQAGQGQTPTAPAQATQQPRRVGAAQNLDNPLPYDLLLKGGHVIDEKNGIDRVTDVGIKNGKIAAVGDNLPATNAAKTVDVAGLYVTPGLIDIHMHMYASTGEASLAGDESLWPDGFTLRSGVTTAVDAGSSGWRTFEDFKVHIIDRSETRVLAMLNIVGAGMRGPRFEDNLADMQGDITGYVAKKYPGVVVGIKSAHYMGPEWQPYIEAVKAGSIANIPVMIDYGTNHTERPLAQLLTQYLRPGDIYTHTYSGLRGEQDPDTLEPAASVLNGRKHGVYFDAGTGQASLALRIAIPLIAAGFKPDSISTDLHFSSMNASTKDMLNVMSKFMAMGLTLQEVVADTTSHPAHEIKRDDLGNLSVGAPADVAVLGLEHGNFGFTDAYNVKKAGTSFLTCELTLRDGKVVYDLNGLSMDLWDHPPTSDPRLASHWTNYRPRPPLPNQLTPQQR